MKKIIIAGYNSPGNRYHEIVDTLKEMNAESFISLDINDMDKADAMIIPGSFQDINPVNWGEENYCSNDINDSLDEIQFKMMEKAEKESKPVMGICRGMQLINVYFGGNLIQDLSCGIFHKKANPEKYHQINTVEHTFMEELYGKKTMVNTRHHQGLGILGKKLTACASWQDEGEVIEAVIHESLPILGVQWHPETMAVAGNEKQREDGKKVFRYFLNL